ncbi:putative ATP-dependent RNA helicase Dbp21E2 isoform X2 [Calliopsis andreniformis]|uniref:putative ATP-dependent RNA helicase Dbp21E2 isoform X2 n=1 Tax=Calliopsis andreniformis TaxID=337506 RepID=UPI003FCE1DFD
MVFRFCNVCYRSIDPIKNFSRHYAKALSNKQRLEETNDNGKKNEKEKIPIILCKKNTLNFYKGQSYSKREKILLASKGWNHRKSRGDHFFIYPYDIDGQKEEYKPLGYDSFNDFNLDSSLCNQLHNLDIIKPLEIQNLAIPKILEGSNAILAAETGCGKTLAYLVPLVNQILQWKQITQRPVNCPLGLIVTPTRELAVQIALELINLSKHLGIQTKMITGGKTKKMMLDPPVDDVDVLVGSFGVLSKLNTVGIYKFDYVRYVVLDEADALFHHSFGDKLNIFMRRLPIGYHQVTDQTGLPTSAQLILASATVPSRLQSVLGDIINLESLQYIKTNKLHKIMVLQKFMRVGSGDKTTELLKFIKPKAFNGKRVIVFSNTNTCSYWLSLFLNECGVETVNLNGTMPLRIRRGKYGEFLNADYIHRCGRTGRVGTIGECRVTNFISKPTEITLVQKIEMAIRKMKPFPIINLRDPQEDVEEEDLNMEDTAIDDIVDNVDDVENIPY